MNPDPPYLLDATQLWKPRELHWIVENGIKMTGMPTWRDTLSGQQITDVVAYLKPCRKCRHRATYDGATLEFVPARRKRT